MVKIRFEGGIETALRQNKETWGDFQITEMGKK
jgi:hypothetical protein